MKRKNVIVISMAVAVLVIVALAVGCSVKKDTTAGSERMAAISSESEEKTDDSAIKDTSTGKGETAKSSDSSEVAKEQKASASSAVTNIDKVQPKTTAKPTPGSNTSSSNTGNSGSSSNTGNSNSGSESAEPAHTHTWVNITKTVDHPAKTHEEDVYEDRQVCVQDAWDEKVIAYDGQRCNQCEFTTTDKNAMDMHMLENGHSCSNDTTYETVHHDAVYETQRVKNGTKTVTDQAAWTEELVTGRRCTSCGATE